MFIDFIFNTKETVSIFLKLTMKVYEINMKLEKCQLTLEYIFFYKRLTNA